MHNLLTNRENINKNIKIQFDPDYMEIKEKNTIMQCSCLSVRIILYKIKCNFRENLHNQHIVIYLNKILYDC